MAPQDRWMEKPKMAENEENVAGNMERSLEGERVGGLGLQTITSYLNGIFHSGRVPIWLFLQPYIDKTAAVHSAYCLSLQI